MANERARQLRKEQTPAERELWLQLRQLKSRGFHFRHQAPIGDYIVDFVCHTGKLVIEVDGGQHGAPGILEHDERRTAWLNGRGYRVLRFWNSEVNGDLEGVISRIRDVIAEAASPPP